MNGRPTAAAAGKIDVGGDLRRAVALDVNFIDTADSYGPEVGACEGSLRRLRLDRIDLYQFHRPDPSVPIAESIGTLGELMDEGKIRYIGVSNVTEQQFRQAERVTAIVSVQNRYNVVDRSSEPMLDLCDQKLLVFIPWAPIEQTGTIPALMAAAWRRGVTERQVALAVLSR